MSQDDTVTAIEQRWAINPDWLKANNRSFTAMVKSSLCPKCRKKLKVDHGEAKANDLLKAVKTCCSKSVDYITPNLPILESIFRVILANGNQPLTLEELGSQLNQRRGMDTYRTSVPILYRLLKNDQHYGLQPVAG
jgi:hypothetical protein